MTYYQEEIEKRIGTHYDSRHIEAYMRIEHGTLDAISSEKFDTEIDIAILCIDEGGHDQAERLAQSYGL